MFSLRGDYLPTVANAGSNKEIKWLLTRNLKIEDVDYSETFAFDFFGHPNEMPEHIFRVVESIIQKAPSSRIDYTIIFVKSATKQKRIILKGEVVDFGEGLIDYVRSKMPDVSRIAYFQCGSQFVDNEEGKFSIGGFWYGLPASPKEVADRLNVSFLETYI